MKSKRGTQRLRKLGFETLEIQKGVWGFYATNNKYKKQFGTTCRDTITEVITDVQAGSMPKKC